MFKARMAKIVAFCIAALCAGALASCTSSSSSTAVSGTAATVNGVEISEATVTSTIENVRAQAGLADTDQWGTWLVANSVTPAEIRQEIIDNLVERVLVKSGAADKGIVIDTAEIDSYVNSMKGNFATEQAWQEALAQAGYTEDEYRATIENSLLQQELLKKFEEESEVTNEALLDSANTYAKYYNGGKRSSHILFDADDTATAQEVLDKIKSGELDFAEAAKEYSLDGSAEDGGDVGWDVSTTFVTEYQEALDALEKDQVSDLVTSQFGIHIIKCTDVFSVEGDVTDLSQVPEDMREAITSSAKYLAGVNAYNAWLTELKDNATVEVKDIPANAPYNIDLTKYEQAAAAAAAAAESESAESASGEATSGDAAASNEAASADSASGEAASSDAAASGEAASADSASSDAASSSSSSSN